MEDDERTLRAAKRRATWPAETVAAGTPKPALYTDASPTQRFEAMERLCAAQWIAAHGHIDRLPRAQWPGEIFEIPFG